MAFLSALLMSRTARTIIAIIVALTALLAAIIYIANRMADATIAEHTRQIEQQNQEAHDDAKQTRDLVGDCYRAGGVWSQVSGNCER